IDAPGTSRSLHSCGACARAASWLSANYARPNHTASRNRGNVLPERPLLRTADLTLGTVAPADSLGILISTRERNLFEPVLMKTMIRSSRYTHALLLCVLG